MTFIKNVWSGHYSLAKHYWLFLVVPQMLFKILDKTVPWDAMPDWQVLPFIGLAIAIYVVALVVALWLLGRTCRYVLAGR
jgi:hypothetical protein